VRKRSLRLRLTVAVGLGAGLLAVLFASLAYVGVRHILVTDRDTTDLRQAYENALLVKGSLEHSKPSHLHKLIVSLNDATSSTSIVSVGTNWYAQHPDDAYPIAPGAMRTLAARDEVSRQVIYTKGSPVLFIDVPLPAVGAVYYELDNLHDLDATLSNLALLFAGGALFTTVLGVLGGRRIIRRSMAPLEVASQAATRIAGGALDTRIPENQRSAEVADLATSFNTMIEKLVAQLDRDARFAGDVSHELRSPLTTLATSVEVMRHSRDHLTPDGQSAFDLLATDVGTFQVLVEDLLEIARYDAGASPIHLETLPVGELVRQCVLSAERRHQLASVPVTAAGPTGVDGVLVSVDRRRFERVITNLLDNAERYGGGAVAIRLEPTDDHITIDVDDAGPGVDLADSDKVFERFYRGNVASARGAARGTGLGLALVADHVEHFGGTVAVLRSPEGGARFRITLPRVAEGDL
jgi:two-component system, OmpR family, sensor histidine kinase MtrB